MSTVTEPITDAIQSIDDVIDDLELAVQAEYRQLVSDSSEGRYTSADGTSRILTAAHKSPATYRADVKKRLQRKQAVADIQRADQDLVKCAEMHKQYSKDFDDFLAFEKDLKNQLEQRRREISAAHYRWDSARREAIKLRKDAIDVLARTADASVNARVAELQAERGKLVDLVANANHALEQQKVHSTTKGPQRSPEGDVLRAQRKFDELSGRQSQIDAEIAELQQRQLDCEWW